VKRRDRRRDRAIGERLAAWFQANARDLPWRDIDPRTGRRDPYASLVAEAMLQQTQVSPVVEKFGAFMGRFPKVERLARADEQEVLSAWSGLGYYRRARSLHRAAQAILQRHGGEVPSDAALLRELPGVGAYTAGSLASIVFGARVPTVDGNIERVILRLDGIDARMSVRERSALVWKRAAELVEGAPTPSAHNEGLMELGATVCTPRGARCGVCPLESLCAAKRSGAVARIPAPKERAAQRAVFHSCVVVRDARGRVLVEQRATEGRGLWSGMWQPPTLERDDRHSTAAELGSALGLLVGPVVSRLTHKTTHRVVEFEVRAGERNGGRLMRGRFVDSGALAGMPVSNPHRRMLCGTGNATLF